MPRRFNNHLWAKVILLTAFVFSAAIFHYRDVVADVLGDPQPPHIFQFSVSGDCSYSATCGCNYGGNGNGGYTVNVVLEDSQGNSSSGSGFKEKSVNISGSLGPGQSANVYCTCSNDAFEVSQGPQNVTCPAPAGPTCVPYAGQSCSSGANACGQTNTGTYDCNGNCSASPPSDPSGYGGGCSASNSCGQSNSGTIQCDGTCSASAPSLPSGYGSSCSATNACGQSNSGTIDCSGSCSASAPANPSGYGNSCTGATSAPNICGMTNPGSSGTIQCDGSCSGAAGSTPADTACPPSATSATESDPNYCTSGPGGYIDWTYSDPSNSPQSAYEVQLSNTGSFNNPFYDSGKLDSSSKVFAIPTGVLQFNTTYKARVMVWNSAGTASSWSNPTGSWKTPPYAYPQVIFTWSPQPPQKGVVTTFTDSTVFSDGKTNGHQFSWTFGDGVNSSQQSPAHTYTTTGTYTITETATDNANQSCTVQHALTIQKPIPYIKEVAPR